MTGVPAIIWAFIGAAGLGNVLGGAIVVARRPSERTLMRLVAVGGGFLIGAALLGMLPRVMDAGSWLGPGSILGGYIGMVLLENLLTHHAHRYDTAGHTRLGRGTALGVWVGMLVHTFFDGVSIAAGFLAGGLALGVIVFEAVILHNAGDGWSVASVVLASGSGRRRAFGAAISIAVTTIGGGVLTLLLGSLSVATADALLGVSMGTFLYIAMTDLMPAVHESKEAPVLVLFTLGGVSLFALSRLIGG